MSKSNKSRRGLSCKRSKDTVLESRSQKQAWAKTKRRRSRIERARQAQLDREENKKVQP